MWGCQRAWKNTGSCVLRQSAIPNSKLLEWVIILSENNFENLDEWIKAILYISRNKKLMQKISMNAKKTAIKYSWDLRAKEYLNQFKKTTNL